MSFDQLDRPAESSPLESLVIRPAMPTDTEDCGRIMHDALAALAAAHGFPKDFPSRESATRRAAALIADPAVFGVVAERGGRVVGSNFLTEGDEVRGLGPVTVEPAMQQAGIGRRLVQAALDRAWGAAGVRLVQDSFNTRALALHAALGFEVKAPLLLMQGFPRAALPRGAAVRPMTEADIPACGALHEAAHGIARSSALRTALRRSGPLVVERHGVITGYLTAPGSWPVNHGVAETEEDLRALLAGAAAAHGEPIALLLPTRQAGLLRWALGAGLRVVKPMALMARGTYRVPARPWFPSVFY